MKSPRRDSDDADSKSSVHESLIQVFSFEKRHATILPRFPVEDKIRCDNSASEDSSAIQELLCEIAPIWSIGGLLHICASESILECRLWFAESG